MSFCSQAMESLKRALGSLTKEKETESVSKYTVYLN